MVGVGAGSAGSAIHLPHHLAAVSVTTAPLLLTTHLLPLPTMVAGPAGGAWAPWNSM